MGFDLVRREQATVPFLFGLRGYRLASGKNCRPPAAFSGRRHFWPSLSDSPSFCSLLASLLLTTLFYGNRNAPAYAEEKKTRFPSQVASRTGWPFQSKYSGNALGPLFAGLRHAGLYRFCGKKRPLNALFTGTFENLL